MCPLPDSPCAAGGRVLVLGCAPGGWLQVACQALGAPARGGSILGVDIQARRCAAALMRHSLGLA